MMSKIVRFPEDVEVTRTDESVLKVSIDLPTNDHEFHVLIRSDAHMDSTHNDWRTERRHLDRIAGLHGMIIDGGDLFDAMQHKKDPRQSKRDGKKKHEEDDDYFDSIVETAASRYSPWAKHFVALGMGNHETSILNHNGTNLTRRLARTLRNDHGSIAEGFGYSFFVIIQMRIHGTKVARDIIYVDHGRGGGAKVTRGAIDQQRVVASIDCDRAFLGHKHVDLRGNIPRESVTRGGKLQIRNVEIIQCAGYKSKPDPQRRDYAAQKGFVASLPTATLLTFKPNPKSSKKNRTGMKHYATRSLELNDTSHAFI